MRLESVDVSLGPVCFCIKYEVSMLKPCVRNKASPLDNVCLQRLWYDWFVNLPDKLTMNLVMDFLFSNMISQIVQNKCFLFVWSLVVWSD